MKNVDVNVEIGERLKAARDDLGLSQAFVAKALGYESATAISLIEAGERKVKAEDLRKAAEVLQRPVSYFLGQEEAVPDVKIALRADKDLTSKDKDAIMHLIEIAKMRKKTNEDR